MVDNQFDDVNETADDLQRLALDAESDSFEDKRAYLPRGGFTEIHGTRIAKGVLPSDFKVFGNPSQYSTIVANHSIYYWVSGRGIIENFDISFERALSYASRLKSHNQVDFEYEPELGLDVDFEPSATLLRLANRDDHVTVGQPNTYAAGILSSSLDPDRIVDSKALFIEKMYGLLAILGFRSQDEVEKIRVLSVDGHFLIPLQHVILAQFDIIPYDAKDFLIEFCSQLSMFLMRGGQIEGDWGSLAIEGREMSLLLPADPVDEGPSSWMTGFEG